MDELIAGTSAYPDADPDLLRQAGIGWLRHNFPFPFEEGIGDETTEAYARTKQRAEERSAQGFRLIGVTPLYGIGKWEPDAEGTLRLRWRSRAPDWMAEPGTDAFRRAYREMCVWLAGDLGDRVPVWQIGNEFDIRQFAGPLNLAQACDLVLDAARGLKEGNPNAVVGHNGAGSRRSWFLAGRLFGHGDEVLDYCGIDQYYGTWQAGGPEDWGPRIAELHAVTGAPVLINEWGFSSAGEVMTDEERRLEVSNCQLRKWARTWGPGHTPQGQAEFVRRAFDQFCQHRSELLGQVFYRWEDQQECWQCGHAECPIETAWGLVDVGGRPKPAFHAFQEGAERLRDA